MKFPYPEEARAVFNFLCVRDQLLPSDVGFVLGASTLGPIKMAAASRVFFDKIAFISTGGNFGGDKVWGMPENIKYKQVLLEEGVPESDILTEGLTQRTDHEAKQAIPFLVKHGLRPRRITLISRPFHQLRAYLTFRRQYNLLMMENNQLPEIEFRNWPANEELNMEDELEILRLVQEIERLIEYGVKGDIERCNIPSYIIGATGMLSIYLRKNPS